VTYISPLLPLLSDYPKPILVVPPRDHYIPAYCSLAAARLSL